MAIHSPLFRLGLVLIVPALHTLAVAQSSGVSRRANQNIRPIPSKSSSGVFVGTHYASLRIPKKKVFMVQTDSLYVDTLIMEDKSVVMFSQPTRLIVENAFIGNDCKLSSAGADGRSEGISGADGHTLWLVITFSSLGSLIIDTHGGNGARGAIGSGGGSVQGGAVVGGGAGGPGGDAGNGGDLTLFYSAVGFIPVFNESRNHSIRLIYHGGKAGGGGMGGPGSVTMITDPSSGRSYACSSCPKGPSGPRGTTGSSGLDGTLRFERIPD